MMHTTSTIETNDIIQDAVGAKKQRKGLFNRIRRRWATEEMPTINEADSTDETEVTAIDTDSESLASSPSPYIYNPSDPSCATYESLPDNTLHSCLNLLSSKSLDLNRVGLQKLNLLINGRSISDSYGSKEISPYVLVLGGPLGSMEELLRFFFVTMICDAPHTTHCYRATRRAERMKENFSQNEETLKRWVLEFDPSRTTTITADPSDESEELTCTSNYALDSERTLARHPQGKAEGVLHNHALKVLATALHKVHVVDPNALAEIDLHCSLWMSIITSLVENIERNHNVNATVYSMKILRILYAAQPTAILPLLKYNLFASLVDLKDYGEKRRLPMVSMEASKLLEHAQFK